ncbi:hypothetical protein CJ030_MR3G015731 [Morella rubra]|uniref:Uncharacterized protein n=1 Tax=Morella rubra TaxID=262757 RepID=A0A6A1W9V7_9ROSI|nr:hypothetical protein CJ030_MR3G015731 [Morella rubra]
MEQTMREHLQMIEEQQRKKDEELMQMMAEQQRKKDEEHRKMMEEQQRTLMEQQERIKEQQRTLMEQQERRMQLMAEQMREQLVEQIRQLEIIKSLIISDTFLLITITNLAEEGKLQRLLEIYQEKLIACGVWKGSAWLWRSVFRITTSNGRGVPRSLQEADLDVVFQVR